MTLSNAVHLWPSFNGVMLFYYTLVPESVFRVGGGAIA